MVRYDYDVFGKITAIKNGSNQAITDTTSIAFLNPLRYRGYVYDDETGLYYLQSRYYDPVTGRFLNADVYASTSIDIPVSTNAFAYCYNNPIFNSDQKGMASDSDYDIRDYWLYNYNDCVHRVKELKNSVPEWYMYILFPTMSLYEKLKIQNEISFLHDCMSQYKSNKRKYGNKYKGQYIFSQYDSLVKK